MQGLLRWIAAHDVPRRVVLLCDDTPLPDAGRGDLVVRVPGCLKDASIGLPAQLLACGVPEVVVVVCGDSPDEVRATADLWRRTILSGVEVDDDPAPRVRWLGATPVSRRGLLGLRSLEGFPLDLDADETARTLAALGILRDRGQAAPEVSEASPARALAVVGCTACGVCVEACPHDALALVHDGATSTLLHARDACRGDLDCVRLCPVDAFTDGGPIPLDDLAREPGRTLAVVATTTCPRCFARHGGASGVLCPACTFRVENAFGSSLPPGAAERLAATRPEGRSPGGGRATLA
jgi:NAD-dependent dihydropyrimidine dehydrogenase PreA subunit